MSLRTSVVLVLFAGSVAQAAQPGISSDPFHVVYGADDRRDLFEIKDRILRKAADADVALFRTSSVSDAKHWWTTRKSLKTESYVDHEMLCSTERFSGQRIGAFCSGSLVGPDLILTAGHCVLDADDCATIDFVFRFELKKSGKLPAEVRQRDVYSCASIVRRLQDNEGADYALIKLDRKVRGHAPLKLDRSKDMIAVGTPLVVMGHPSGLPLKFAGGTRVRRSEHEGFFVANADTYAGNSGSAVLNARTGALVGVLVRGNNDFELSDDGSCRKSVLCSEEGCRGEDITRVSQVLDLVH